MNGVQTRNVIGFPDQLASDSKKGSKEYGLVVARAIESEWFRKESGTSRFYNNRTVGAATKQSTNMKAMKN